MQSVVVVLGAPNADDGTLSPQAVSRVRTAVARLSTDVAAQALPTGGFGEHFNRTSVAHHEYIRRALEELGVASHRILDGVPSTNTAEDAALVASALAADHDAHVVVVTADYHVGRARWHFERVLAGRPIEMLPAPSDGLDAGELERLAAHEREAMGRLGDG